MNFPSRTSKLLAFLNATDAELNIRFRDIFVRHRGGPLPAARITSSPNTGTPESAAANYEFGGYETNNGDVVLYGTQQNAGFVYRIAN